MGGLVAKKCLIRSSLRSHYRPMVSSTTGMVFFGTPHLGSTLGPLASIINRIATAAGLASRSLAPAELQAHESGLREIDADFAEIGNHIAMVSFFEERVTAGLGRVSPPRRGVSNCFSKLGTSTEKTWADAWAYRWLRTGLHG